MKKKFKKYSVNYESLNRVRTYTMEQIVKCLNDDSCNLSSCEIRKYVFDVLDM